MDATRRIAQAQCEAEGLTEEQAACFEDINNVESLFRSADGPAIANNKPSWLSVPPPEVRREVLERMKARKASEP